MYNPQKTLDGFTAFFEMLRTSPLPTQLLPTICMANANLNSPLWNPSHSKQADKDSDTLIELLTEWGLSLRSPKGIPTFGVCTAHTEGTSIDQVWVDKGFDDALITCFIYKSDIVSHQSDHQALITIFSAESGDEETSKTQAQVNRSWHKVNSADLHCSLTTSLPKIRPLVTQDNIKGFDTSLRTAIIDALNKNSPKKAACGKHKVWWRPEILDPLRKEALRLCRLSKKEGTAESHAAYTKARNTFNRAIDTAKENSWRLFLSGVDHTNLFQAKWIASGHKASSLVSTIITDDGRTCSTNAEKAEALFAATCVATAPCRLDSTNHLNFPLDDTQRPTAEVTPPLLSTITRDNIAAIINDSPPPKSPRE